MSRPKEYDSSSGRQVPVDEIPGIRLSGQAMKRLRKLQATNMAAIKAAGKPYERANEDHSGFPPKR